MKRSEINAMIKQTEEVFEKFHFCLPQCAYFSPMEWHIRAREFNEARNTGLGWTFCSFGKKENGIIKFVLRNGSMDIAKYHKTYAESVFVCFPGKSVPRHCHISRMQDIINRGGGDLLVRVYGPANEKREYVDVRSDGRTIRVPVGAVIRLAEGESATIPAGHMHDIMSDTEPCIVGEISTFVGHDTDDVYPDTKIRRKHRFEEDEPPYRLLVKDYQHLAGAKKLFSDSDGLR